MRRKEAQAGELQMRKAFEETTNKNLKTVVQFSQETRKMVRDFDKQIKNLTNIVLSKNAQIDQMQNQIAQLLQEKYKNGS